MIRLLFILVFLLALALPHVAPLAAEQSPMVPAVLNEIVDVQGPHVRVGDIFRNAGARADEVVAYAPPPGKQVVFDAYWLQRVAQTYRVDWRPLNRLDRTVVRRDSRVVNQGEIAARLRQALIEQEDIDDMIEVDLTTRDLRLFVPSGSASSIAVRDLVYDPRSRRFSAVLLAPADDPRATTIAIQGRVHPVVEVPVLANRVAADTVIGENDIAFVQVRQDRIDHNIIVEPGNLIGKAPKRATQPGRALRSSDVRRPVLVEKGGLVTMSIDQPGMSLSARGKALDNGSEGDTVRVTNIQSNTVVEARVSGPGRVTVTPISKLARN